jgi:hypothetical protein
MESNLVQSPSSLTYSQRRARALLAAWNSASLPRLQSALAPFPSQPVALTSDEEERMEMVAEVEHFLRSWLDRSGPEGSARKNEIALLASLKLLRHLAGCEALGRTPDAPYRGLHLVSNLVWTAV